MFSPGGFAFIFNGGFAFIFNVHYPNFDWHANNNRKINNVTSFDFLKDL